MVIEQGYEMERPSIINVEVSKQGGEIQKIRVGGQTQAVFTGRMNLAHQRGRQIARSYRAESAVASGKKLLLITSGKYTAMPAFFPDPGFLWEQTNILSKGGPFPDRTSGMSQYPQIP